MTTIGLHHCCRLQPQVLTLRDSHRWFSSWQSITHVAAVMLTRTWICRGFVAIGCLPPAARRDGGVHDNVDVREPALVESCLFQWVLQWLQPLGHLCQDLSMTRFCVLCDFLCRTAQAAEAAMSSSKVTSSKGSWISIKSASCSPR